MQKRAMRVSPSRRRSPATVSHSRPRGQEANGISWLTPIATAPEETPVSVIYAVRQLLAREGVGEVLRSAFDRSLGLTLK